MRFHITILLLTIGLFIHSQDHVCAEVDDGGPWAIIEGAIGPALAHDSFLFVAHGKFLHVIDQRDRHHPKLLDRPLSLYGPIVTMKMKYPALYCLVHSKGKAYWGIQAVDLSRPTQPQAIDMDGLRNIKMGDTDVKLSILGDQLYISDYEQAFDIRNPLKPARLDLREGERKKIESRFHSGKSTETLHIPENLLFTGNFSRVCTEGQRLHIDDGKGRDHLFDLSNHECPKYLGSTRLTSQMQSGVTIVPFSLNAIPFKEKYRVRFVQSEELGNSADAVAIEEPTSSTKPRRIAGIGLADDFSWRHISGMYLSGSLLFLAVNYNYSMGLACFIVPVDLSNPTQPQQLDNFAHSNNEPDAMAMDDHYIYVVWGSSLHIFRRQGDH